MKDGYPPMKKYLLAIAFVIACPVLAFMLSGCGLSRSTANKQVRHIDGKYPDILSHFCADAFPVKDSVIVYEDFRPGEIHYLIDTVATVDTITHEAVKVITRIQHKTDTVVRNEYHSVENTARLRYTSFQLDSTSQKLIEVSNDDCRHVKQRNTGYWAAGIGWLIIIASLAIRIWKPKLIS